MKTIRITSEYLAPVSHYALMYQADEIEMEVQEHFIKQSFRNRCNILSANGPMTLTIPVEKSELKKPCLKDMKISDHGNWRHLHWNAIKSSYNSSAFFEYYRDDFEPFYEKKYEYLAEFNEALRALVFEHLDMDKIIRETSSFEKHPENGIVDLRAFAEPQIKIGPEHNLVSKPYYQVFQTKYGFQPDLSIIDLLFNMGPESELILRDMLL
ncbi:MAG: WbqC family protein [Bacteroidales bacterium]